jgi:hypothetical protein
MREDSIEMDFRELGCGMDWINLAQDGEYVEQWQLV